MEDCQIVDLYWQRSENAIAETDKKYGSFCHTIAYNILHNPEDSDECVNDTYLKTWNLLPPKRPRLLSPLLGKITRNLSLDRYRKYMAEKRGGGQMPLALEELSTCVLDGEDSFIERRVLTDILNQFLDDLPEQQRKVFVQRYWYVCSIQEIAGEYGMTQSKVKMMLLRLRSRLREELEQEGFRYE